MRPAAAPRGGGHAPRLTSAASFWDARYRTEYAAFGTAPTPLVVEEAARFAHGARVIDLGAGEGRNALFLARRGVCATALDFAGEGLVKAALRARAAGLPLDLEAADLRDWQPAANTLDGIVCVFVHLLPDERRRLYDAVVHGLRPGGALVAEWFTPEQLRYASGGPSAPDRLVDPGDLIAAFSGAGAILRCEAGERVLDEGPFLQGAAGTVRFVFEKAPDGRSISG